MFIRVHPCLKNFFFSAIVGLVATLFALPAVAAEGDPQPIPPLKAHVTDLTGTLDAQQQQQLEGELTALEQSKGSQLGVLVVPTTQPEDIAQYGIRVGDAWKLGRKGTDDGVILIVAKNDRRVRIEVGRGLEGAIPDAAAARIIREYVTPKFRTGDFFGGIHDATDALTKLIQGEPLPPPLTSDEEEPTPLPALFIVAAFMAAVLRVFLDFLPSRIAAFPVGAIIGGGGWYLTHSLGAALVCGLIGFFVGWLHISTRGAGGGIWRGGSGGGGGGFGGGFSGGGGSFGGGGASGSW